MFRAIAPSQFINDAGVEVPGRARNGMQYRDGYHVLSLHCDAIADDSGRSGAAILLALDLHWDPPFEGERMDLFVCAAIAKNLLEAWGVVDCSVTIES